MRQWIKHTKKFVAGRQDILVFISNAFETKQPPRFVQWWDIIRTTEQNAGEWSRFITVRLAIDCIIYTCSHLIPKHFRHLLDSWMNSALPPSSHHLPHFFETNGHHFIAQNNWSWNFQNCVWNWSPNGENMTVPISRFSCLPSQYSLTAQSTSFKKIGNSSNKD